MSDTLSFRDFTPHHFNQTLKEALMAGAGAKARAVVERYLSLPPETTGLNDYSQSGQTPLMMVMDMDIHPHYPVDVELVRLLLKAGASVEVPYVGCSSPLYLALRSGNPEVARLILDAGADMHFRQKGRGQESGGIKSMLIWAIESGQHEAALCILAADADPHGVPEQPRPLQAAARHGDLEVAKILVQKGADVNARYPDSVRQGFSFSEDNYPPSNTALMEAVRIDGNPVLAFLLEQGADVHMRNDKQATALHHATPMFSPLPPAPHNIELLLEWGAKPDVVDDQRLTPLMRSLYGLTPFNGMVRSEPVGRAVEALLEHGADPNLSFEKQFSPLGIAVSKGDATSILLLLKAGARVTDSTSLWLVASEEESPVHLELRQLLAQREVIPHPNVLQFLFQEAVGKGNLNRVRVLIQAGVNVEVAREGAPGTLLHTAVASGFADIVQELLQAGANPNARSSKTSSTPLMLAVEHGRQRVERGHLSVQERIATDTVARAIEQDLSIVRALLAAGADLEARNHNQSTPLHFAVKYAAPSILRVLLDAGANVHALSIIGRTPLPTLLSYDRHRQFLEEGAPLTRYCSLTPPKFEAKAEDSQPQLTEQLTQAEKSQLEYAREWDETTVRMLLEAGANPNSKGRDGYSALALASMFSTFGVIQLLLKAGASLETPVPIPDGVVGLILHRGRTQRTLQKQGFDFEALPWLKADLIAAAHNEIALSELAPTASFGFKQILEDEVEILKLLLK